MDPVETVDPADVLQWLSTIKRQQGESREEYEYRAVTLFSYAFPGEPERDP